MNSRMVALGAMMVTLPIVVEVPDSTDTARGDTRFTLIGGLGRYAIIDRGCEGEVLRRHPGRFRELGAAIEHRIHQRAAPSSHVALGVRVGTIRDHRTYRYTIRDYPTYTDRDTTYVVESNHAAFNPFVGLEAEKFGVGMGWVTTDRGPAPRPTPGDYLSYRSPPVSEPMSFHLRAGSLERTYYRLSHREGLPFWTAGNFELGFGSRASSRLGLYVGLTSGEPFDRSGLCLQADYRMAPHWLLTTRARL